MDDQRRHNETSFLAGAPFHRLTPAQELRPSLVVMQGANVGLRYLLNEARLVMGRGLDQAQLVLPDRSVSGVHAVVTRTGEGVTATYSVQDLGSRNGTFVNGTRLEGSETRVLVSEDRIALGETVLKFTLMDDAEGDFYGKISSLMYQDDLTGLVNKRRFDTDYHVSFESAVLRRRPIAVVMMDMDRVKQINDTHGHHYGAYTIAATGKLIGAAFRPPALATRFGGDEFIAYIPGLRADAAVEVAQSVVQAVRDFVYELDGVRVYPTLSVGVAAYPDAGPTPEELVRAADAALYRAKQNGRNQASV
ncbi:MAG: diguanylate cyclase [Planctomycetota bacterium]